MTCLNNLKLSHALFNKVHRLQELSNRIGLRLAAPLGNKIAVEEIPDEHSVIALRLEKIGSQVRKRLGCRDKKSPFFEFLLLGEVFAFD